MTENTNAPDATDPTPASAQSTSAPPSGRWVYVTDSPKAPSSGLRVAAGIAAIVLGLFSSIPAIIRAVHIAALADYLQRTNMWGIFFWPVVNTYALIATATAAVVAGIFLLTRHRGRRPAAPIVVAVIAVLAMVVIPGSISRDVVGFIGAYALAVATLVLSLLALVAAHKVARSSGLQDRGL